MFLQLFINAPLVGLVWVIVILISLTVHEFAHAYVANLKGDHTAEREGRLTLNPIAHIDPIGFIPLLLLGFGWAKPVPFNPYNLEHPKRDAVHIALAGPFANLILAITAGVGIRLMSMAAILDPTNLLVVFLVLLLVINLFLLFFNILPIHPLDGSKLVDALLTKPEHAKLRVAIATYGPQLLLLLIVLSILTNFDAFFFVSIPSYLSCAALSGQNCAELISSLFIFTDL